MNIESYRRSFTVFVADSIVDRGHETCEILLNAGYTAEQRLSPQSLRDEIERNPPHIVIFQYDDPVFFATPEAYREEIENLARTLPETQLFFLTGAENESACCQLYEYGVFDCIVMPAKHPMQFLKAIDRAAETNYYMYLSEQDGGESPASSSSDFSMLEVFFKSLKQTKTQDEMIQLYLREGARHLRTDKAIYFRYSDSKRTLVASHAVGVESRHLEGVGLDLQKTEPGFFARQLLEPQRIASIQEFVHQGLHRSKGLVWPLANQSRPLGVFVFAAPANENIRDDANEDSYMNLARLFVEQHMQFVASQNQIARYSIYETHSEALNEAFFRKKIEEEVSRARRIEKPVALVLVAIDGYADLSLEQSAEAMHRFVKAFHEVLQKTSRINDLIGRVSPDIFALCLPHTGRRGAIVKAERLRRIIEMANFSSILGSRGKITVSLGLSEYPSLSRDAEEIMRSAERALIEIKKQGHNRIGLAVVPEGFSPDFLVEDAKRSFSSAARRN